MYHGRQHQLHGLPHQTPQYVHPVLPTSMYPSPTQDHASPVPYPLLHQASRPSPPFPSHPEAAQDSFKSIAAPNLSGFPPQRNPSRVAGPTVVPSQSAQSLPMRQQAQPVIIMHQAPGAPLYQGVPGHPRKRSYAEAAQWWAPAHPDTGYTGQGPSVPTLDQIDATPHGQASGHQLRTPLQPRTDPRQQPGLHLDMRRQPNVHIPAAASLSQENINTVNQHNGWPQRGDAVAGWVDEPRATGERTGLSVKTLPSLLGIHPAMSPQESMADLSTLGNSRRPKAEIMSAISDYMCSECRASCRDSAALR